MLEAWPYNHRHRLLILILRLRIQQLPRRCRLLNSTRLRSVPRCSYGVLGFGCQGVGVQEGDAHLVDLWPLFFIFRFDFFPFFCILLQNSVVQFEVVWFEIGELGRTIVYFWVNNIKLPRQFISSDLSLLLILLSLFRCLIPLSIKGFKMIRHLISIKLLLTPGIFRGHGLHILLFLWTFNP